MKIYQTFALAGFYLFQFANVGLIKDGKIGAGKVRATKIAQVLNFTRGN